MEEVLLVGDDDEDGVSRHRHYNLSVGTWLWGDVATTLFNCFDVQI